MLSNLLFNLPNITVEELTFLKDICDELTEKEQNTFVAIYVKKRRNPSHLQLFAILGFFGIAGLPRFFTNQIVMGLLYFFTGGLFFLGTIADLINHKNMANKYNKIMAKESLELVML